MLRLDFWIWLVVTGGVYWTVPLRARLPVLAGSCLAYVGWIQPELTAAILLSALLVHRALRAIDPKLPRPGGIGLVATLALLLAAWKFLPTLWAGLTFKEVAAANLVPLGLSYLVFKLIHVIIEVRRGALAVPDLPEFLAYLFFVPMFTAGPIERFGHFTQHRDARWSRELWVEGGTRIIWGLVKKFGLSEGILYHFVWRHHLEDPGLDVAMVPTGVVWLVAALNYLRIYLDFSGYSDLALGTARLLGFRLGENFNWPVLAANPSDFWRRWHISLSQWCQLYIYMPTMGALRSPYLPLFLSFLVIGTWHILSWNRVGWAVYNTVGVIIFMIWGRWLGRPRSGSWRTTPAWKVASILLTQVFVLGSVAFFMNGEDQTLGRSLELLGRMLGLNLGGGR